MNISITKTTTPKQKPADETLRFGTVFTDHMFLLNYTETVGWHDARIVPYGPLDIEPSSMVLHYAQEIFEGMKAYRTETGAIQLFRPMENFNRLNASCRRMCIPELDADFLLEALKELLRIDAAWVPHAPGTSLYIRPFAFANENCVGVHTAREYLYCVICSPVGAYYPEGINPVRIYIEDEDVRTVRGGTGEAKAGGNYAASLRAGERAHQKGFSQVLWVDGIERKYVEEVGSMNVFFKINGEMITPILNGSVLPGITRKSCIQLLRDWGYPVTERLLTVDELLAAARAGTLEEAFGSGTAAVVSPIGSISYQGEEHQVHGGNIGAVTQRLYDHITGIQWGSLPDPYSWVETL